MPSVIAYGCDDATTQFHPLQIDIREPGEGEIYFDVAYAGICHSDIHSARGEWGPVAYPLVPGHEFVGTVAKVGPGVTTFKVGDRVGVGCLVGSCGTCEMCESGYEQWCTSTPGTLWTYRADAEGNPTTGGYSRGFTVRADFALHIPSELDFAACAPLLCAGITTYSPLKHYNVGPGSRVAILGMGVSGTWACRSPRPWAQTCPSSLMDVPRKPTHAASVLTTSTRPAKRGLSNRCAVPST